MHKGFVVVIFTLSVCQHYAGSISLEQFLTLNAEEKLKLDLLAEKVRHKASHAYMKEELYLIMWLRAEFDVKKSEAMFLEMLRWRRAENIDRILEENWADFDQEFRFDMEGCDKEGRPIISILVEEWDMRKMVITHGSNQLLRYTMKFWEEATTYLRAMREDGQNVTQCSLLIDMEHFNLPMHACVNCIPLSLNIIQVFQKYYPGYVHKIMLVNTPSIATPIWELIRNILTPSLRDTVEIHGKNKAKWRHRIYDFVDPSQISDKFGGFKSNGLDIRDFRLSGQVFRCQGSLWDLEMTAITFFPHFTYIGGRN